MDKMQLREWGVAIGQLPTGTQNAITDVEGVKVGHHTLNEGDNIRTGVTAILPHGGNLFTDKVMGAVHRINGFGKACGFEQVRELGTIETPILLTSTLNVGKVADVCITYMLRDNPDLRSINPLVGECNDGYLNDIQGRHVATEHVLLAIENARGSEVAVGCVGAGTGTSCYGYKGGIGTASRVINANDKPYTVGVLMQTNFGRQNELTIAGVPVGQHLKEENTPDNGDGSVMIVIATDAPLTSRQLGRLTHRAAFGLGRTGTVCHHGSGDFVVAFSTDRTRNYLPDHEMPMLNDLFQAVVECVEESVYCALLNAKTITGVNGHTLNALPHEAVRRWLVHYNRLS
ncbi:MAG: P1 family peptidase [Chloroflexota bacterium]